MHASAHHEVNSVWITANAGSGKTTALTERVVVLLLRGVVPERICCITYTKAAASEMRHRVLGLLRRLLLLPEPECRALLERLLGTVATDEQLAYARGLFGRVLDSPAGGLQLTTIHGFCQHILRLFPIEAGIAPHFTVLEDAAAEGMLRTAKHRLLSQFTHGDAWLTDALTLMGARSGEARFDTLMADIIGKRTAWQAVWQHQTPELLRTRLWALHGLEEQVDDEALVAALCGCIDEEATVTIRGYLPQLIGHSKKTEQKMGEGLARWLETPIDGRTAMLEEFCLLFLNKEGERRKTILGEKEFPAGTPLRAICDAVAQQVEALCRRRWALACAEESFAVAILARALLDLYAQAKEAAHALDYEDLIAKTRELFSQPTTLGWVMSKLDHRIDHLLVDEAQDTSAEQWHIVHALVEELMAAGEGIGSGGHPRSLLVVGDEKQSIYSFQGAAPELFMAKHAIFSAMLEFSAAPLAERLLDTSYRSAQAVLTLVDHIAAQPEVAAALSAKGMTPPHRLHRADAAGMVMLYPPIQAPEKEKPAALTIPKEYQIIRSGAQLLAEEVASRVAGWLAEGRVIETTGKAITAGDIIILVRSRAPLVLPLIRALQRNNIAVAGMDRLTLSGHLAVRDLLALMAWCVNPADDLALAQVLRSPIVGMGDDALRAVAYGRGGSLWAALDVAQEATELARWLGMKDASPYDFLTDVLEVNAARRAFAMRFGEEVHEVLDELKTQAAAMPMDIPPTLAHFVDWVAGNPRQIKREQEGGTANHLRIMTVHGAKGLEAPVVLLVDTVNVPTTQHERIYQTRDAHGQLFPALALSEGAKQAPVLARAKQEKSAALLAEYQRLLYVALTRARDELHVFASAKGDVRSGAWYERIASSMAALGAQEEKGVSVLRGTVSGGNIMGRARHTPSSVDAETFANLPEWAVTPVVPLHQALESVAPSSLAPAGVSPYAQGAAYGAKERGVRIHRVLELLDASSDAATISKLVAHVAPDWSAQEKAEAAAEINALYTQHQWLWQHKAQAEASVCGTIDIGGVATPIQGQIDLLIETPDAVIILDYKTGRRIPLRAEEVPLNYLLQLKTYHALIAMLSPAKAVRCAILWTHAPELMWLDDVVAATGWPNKNVMKPDPVAA